MLTEDIHPMSDHRANLTEHLRHVRETGRPMVITQNGRPAAVVISPERYDELVRASDVAAIRKGLVDAEADRGQDAKDALREIAGKHGLKLDR